MNHDPEDPRLTAYALGELPAHEAEEVEALLAESPEALQEVEEIRGFAGVLAEVFEREAASKPAPDVDLGVVHADAVATASQQSGDAGEAVPSSEGEDDGRLVPLPVRPWRWGHGLGVGLGLAAAVSLLTLPWWLPTRAPRESVKQMAARGSDPGSDSSSSTTSAVATAVLPVASTGAEPEPSTTDPVPLPASPIRNDSLNTPAPEMSAQLMRRYGLTATGAATEESRDESRSGNTPTPPESRKRFALLPTDAAALTPSEPSVESPQPAARAQTFTMSPELMRRYGLTPSPSTAPVPAPAPSSESGSARGSVSTGLAPSMRSRSALRAEEAPSSRLPTSRYGLASSESLVPDAYRRVRPLHLTVAGLELEAPSGGGNNPGYVDAGDNAFESPLSQPLSTFGLDVDTGSYANVRRFLNAGTFPPRAAVRIEEMINYFPYGHAEPEGDEVFGVRAEVAMCPWEPRHRLVRIALKARAVTGEPPVANLVFLVDVSGSMQPGERLPLLKQALRALAKRLAPSDRVAIVTYASSAGVHLESTSAEEKDRILEAIDSLASGGSTNGEGGIRQAYEVARRHFIPGGVNRVLLCTDGDFNVGMSDQNDLVRLIESEAKSGVFLTTLGVGTDNFKDALMRRLADKGNGSYHYLDSQEEAQRVLLEQKDATFVTVARDAKAQVEFNPGNVAAWRLIGYEKRLMPAQDFNDDTKDAGEVGAGQTVTVLYEIVPVGVRAPGSVDPLKYQPVVAEPTPKRVFARSSELLTLKLRYQRPEGSRSVLKEIAVEDREREPDADFKFAAAVAAFGMALRDPSWNGGRGFDTALTLAQSGLGADPGGWRAEFLTLVRKARGIRR
ncbi:MAG: von Willebrand factor type A domain-containing protein [Limisphaerales bacterium]